jgi:mono/diheme cytochrome c family protein
MRHRPALLLATVLCGLPIVATAAVDDTEPSRAMYLRYCGACHGPAGKGDGIAGTFMRPKPADLTQIAKRNGGTFPFERVRASIDGTTVVGAHGDARMPVWGELFRDEAGWEVTRRAEARGKLLLITDYVRSIQEK